VLLAAAWWVCLARANKAALSHSTRHNGIFHGIREIRAIRDQILKTPMVIKPSNQSKAALSLT
jgi:hypothetical protein